MLTDKTTEMDRQILEEIRQTAAMRKKAKTGEPAYKPPVRVRRPWLGWLSWKKHKRRLAGKRKAANQRARKARREQNRARRRAS